MNCVKKNDHFECNDVINDLMRLTKAATSHFLDLPKIEEIVRILGMSFDLCANAK